MPSLSKVTFTKILGRSLWLLLGIFAGSVIFYPSIISSSKRLALDRGILTVIEFLAGACLPLIAFVAFKYLEEKPSKDVATDNANSGNPFHIGLATETLFSNALKRALVENYTGVSPTIAGDYPTNEHISSIQNDYIEHLKNDFKHSQKFSNVILLQHELKAQISRLVKNSNLNLVIGISTTLLAMSVLGLSIYYQQRMTCSLDLLQYFLPRVSTVILIEVFSFFFLKLYKSNLNDIKYFQNEITNLNFKLCALKTAIYQADDETASAILKDFAATERNFILQKGQSTEKLELLKVEQKGDKNIVDSIVNVVKSAKGN